MTTYNIFPQTLIATPHLTPTQATTGAAVVFQGTTPYDFEGVALPMNYEPSAAEMANLVVGNTYHVEFVYTSVGNPAISLVETTVIPTDASGGAIKRPVFDMFMFTLGA